MPAPTNISFLTATALGALPATVTQRVDDAGTTYTVYYSFTAASDAEVIGAWAFGDVTTYHAALQIYVGPASAPVGPLLNITAGNVPCQFPVVAGTQYFLRIAPSSGNPTPANLTLNVQQFAPVTVPKGALAIPDDTEGFPLAFMSSTADFTALRYILGFPSGEAGDTLADGTICMEDPSNANINVYDNTLTLLGALTPATTSHVRIRTCLTPQVFYVALGTNPVTVRTITAAAAFGPTTYTLTGNTTCIAVAASNDEATLYFARSGIGEGVRTWITASDTAGADLAVGIALYSVVDILVLSDDTILVSFYKGNTDLQVKRYNAAGAVLNTYTFGSSFASTAPRLAYAIDDPNSFWTWIHLGGANLGKAQFLNVKVSDGTFITTRNQEDFEAGQYAGTETATPNARFGQSFSCPFWIVRAQSQATEVFTIRRQRRFLLPSSDDNKRVKIPVLELLQQGGIGLTPAAWNSTANLPQGANPQVMMRISKDGGKTWGPERWRSAGQIGKFLERVRWLQATGVYRNAVCEITVTDPVNWAVIGMMGTPEEGSS